jgi:hypothetical protein
LNGSWQTFSEASGQAFTNQGLCIAYAIHHPVSLFDLASSHFNAMFSLISGCSFVGASFGATYPGSSAVGTVMLRTNGCVPLGLGPDFPFTFLYAGTFTITTAVGSLSGSVAGQITNVLLPPPTELNLEPVAATLTLTATSGTGLFAGTTGNVNLGFEWTEPGSPPIVGTITPA